MKIQLSDHFTYTKLFRFCFPPIIMMIFTSVYGVVDGLFISNFVGKTPFAAVNLIMPFLIILGGVGFMIGTGGSALVAKTMGEGDKHRANRYFTMMVMLTVVCGIILSVLGIIFVRPISYLLGATDDMIGDCVTYGRVLLIFNTAFMLQNVFQTFLTTAEKPKFGLFTTVAAGVTNIALDALFIIVFDWGGAGIVMMLLAQTLSSALAMIFVGYDAELFEMTKHAFRLFSFSFILAGVNIFASSFFTALNNGRISAAISFLLTLVFQMLSVLILPVIFGLDGIWWAISVAEVFAFIISMIFLFAKRNKYHYF